MEFWFTVYAGSEAIVCVKAKYAWLACYYAACISEYERGCMKAFLV